MMPRLYPMLDGTDQLATVFGWNDEGGMGVQTAEAR